jgi:small nuclear ribonucleoprotein (snRNP)-like protein
VVVELKDDSEIYGIVAEVDHSTTITMINCRHVFTNGKEILSDCIHVNGKSIRYVHLPVDVKVSANLESYASILDKLHKVSKPKSYSETESKKRRLEAGHEEKP